MTSLQSIHASVTGEARQHSREIMRKIPGAAPRTWADAVAVILAVRERQPPLYEEEQRKVQDLYRGEQKKHTVTALQERFSKTYQSFKTMSLNITRTVADMGAMSYRGAIEHHVRLGDVEYAESDAELTGRASHVLKRLRHIKEASRYELVMPALERRVGASLTHFVRVAVRSGVARQHRKRYALTLHWPADVWVLEDDDHPGEIHAALAYVVRLDGGTFEMGVRKLAPDGTTRGWAIDRFAGQMPSKYDSVREPVSPGGQHMSRFDYDGVLMPLCVVHSVYSDTIYAQDKNEIIDVQDAVNVGISSFWLKDDIQGFSQQYAIGPEQRQGQTMITGPLTIQAWPTGTTLGTMSTQHDLTTLQGVERHLRFAELALRLPHESLSMSQQASSSGFSRVLQSMPALERREENVKGYKLFEAEQLWPVLCEQHDLYEAGDLVAPIGEVDVVPVFPKTPDYESPTESLTRALIAMNAGLITRRRAAVMGKLFASESDAALAGVPDEYVSAPVAEVPDGMDKRLRSASDIGVRDGILAAPTTRSSSEGAPLDESDE